MLGRLERSAPEILGVARILVGTLFACLGARTVMDVLGGIPEGPPAVIVGIAGGIELFGGTLLAAGSRVAKAER